MAYVTSQVVAEKTDASADSSTPTRSHGTGCTTSDHGSDSATRGSTTASRGQCTASSTRLIGGI